MTCPTQVVQQRMTEESVEFENVRIGNWQIRLPSLICTDPNIFQQIFSSQTWTQILTVEQRSRITKMLPKEIQGNPSEFSRTMEDLFSGTLTRFGSNPLGSFFAQLDAGHFDPGVVETKKEIKKVWRKDALRRRKKYHTKLLEDLVLSREGHLKKFSTEEIARVQNQAQKSIAIKLENQQQLLQQVQNQNQNLKFNLNHEQQNQNQKTQQQQGKGFVKKSGLFPPDNQVVTVKHVAKRIFDEVTSVNNSAARANCSSSGDGPPASKKPTMASVAAANKSLRAKTNNKVAKIVITKLEPGEIAKLPSKPQQQQNKSNNSTSATNSTSTTYNMNSNANTKDAGIAIGHGNLVQVNPTAVKTREEQAAAQMARFPKILPAPSGNSAANHLNTKQTTSSTNKLGGNSNSVVKIQPMNTGISSNVSKNSPILASQLQAPIMNHHGGMRNSSSASASTNHSHAHAHAQTLQFPAIAMDDMDSDDSDDEFEAIEPTIGFAPNLVVFPPKPSSKQSTNRGNSYGSSSRNSSSTLRQSQPAQNAQVKFKSNTPTSLSTQQKIPNLIATTSTGVKSAPVSKISTGTLRTPAASTSSNSTTQGQSQGSITTATSFLAKQLLRPTPPTTTAPKLLPISIANLSTLTPQNKVAKLHSYFTYTSSNSSTSSTLTTAPMAMAIATATTAVTAINGPTQTQTKFVVKPTAASTPITSVVTGTTTATASPLTLSLSDLNLNLNLGLGLSLESAAGTKQLMADLDDKIDDLSVLDGNPFDSIPNLSDELDGFDLDLVDGLCDFDVLLSEEKQYASFFSLIRDMLCSTRDHRMTLNCLERAIRKWALSPIAALNLWFLRINDWNDALITALNFLAGNYQGSFHVHPEDFVPYIEYKYKTKYYQWIGAGRDSDNNLLPLCNMWLDNLDRLPPLKKHEVENEDQEEDDDENEDSEGPGEEIKKKSKRPQTPPPPRCVTDWTVRPSTAEEKERFQQQERIRFENPHKAFTYQVHSYESVVGPVKGVYSSQSGMTNKARGHSLLVDDRPPYVTILALVRDAVARLPNGEGTRSEICEMLRDSAFLAAEASNVTLNSVVSGALDRLHYERDPCVRYDSHKKSWIYLHRDRTQEQFERLHHNRSYTKSTKSRSNTSRKSRNKGSGKSSSSTSSQGQGQGQLTAGTSTSTTVSEASTSPGDPPPLTSGLRPQSTTTLSTSTSTTQQQQPIAIAVKSKPPPLPPVGSIVTKSIHIPVSVNAQQKFNLASTHDVNLFDVPPASGSGSQQLKEILSSPPKSSASIVTSPLKEILSSPATTVPKLQYRTATAATTTSSGSQDWAQSLGQSVELKTSTSSQSVTTLPHQTIQVQLTPAVSTATAAHAQASLNHVTMSGISSASAVTATTSTANANASATLGPGQFLLGSNTLLRLASGVRFPEGGMVRLAQFRLPIQQQNGPLALSSGQTQNAGSSATATLRLPQQQRFVFTRATSLPGLSGQGQTQGVLLGQTPSGQTIIFSGNLGSSQPFTISPQFQQQQQQRMSNPNTSTTANTPAINSVGQQQPHTLSLTLAAQTTATQNSASGLGLKPNTSTGASLFNSVSVGTPVTMPSNSGTGTGYSITAIRPQQLQQQSLPSLAQVSGSGSEITLSATPGQGQGQMTSTPFIIRSQQGEFVIPTQISLGRGVQGIKMIPVSAGKQTLLARLMSPGTTTAMTGLNNVATSVAAHVQQSATPTPTLTATATATEQL